MIFRIPWNESEGKPLDAIYCSSVQHLRAYLRAQSARLFFNKYKVEPRKTRIRGYKYRSVGRKYPICGFGVEGLYFMGKGTEGERGLEGRSLKSRRKIRHGVDARERFESREFPFRLVVLSSLRPSGLRSTQTRWTIQSRGETITPIGGHKNA